MSYRLFLFGICVLSVILLLLIGQLGEELRNFVSYDVRPQDVGCFSRLVLENYPLNSGHFLFSLTPAMIIFLGMGLRPTFQIGGRPGFWPFFAFMWLLVLIYFAVFAYALMLPYHMMMEVMGHTPVWIIAAALDGLLLLLGLGVILRRVFQKKSCKG